MRKMICCLSFQKDASRGCLTFLRAVEMIRFPPGGPEKPPNPCCLSSGIFTLERPEDKKGNWVEKVAETWDVSDSSHTKRRSVGSTWRAIPGLVSS